LSKRGFAESITNYSGCKEATLWPRDSTSKQALILRLSTPKYGKLPKRHGNAQNALRSVLMNALINAFMHTLKRFNECFRECFNE
jgi:hypothetical protein